MRQLERLAADPGETRDLAALIRARIRAGAISVKAVRDALYFSAPMGAPKPEGRVYNWWPVATSYGALLITPHFEFIQHPHTLVLSAACQMALGGYRWRSARNRELPSSTWDWMQRRGFLISDTGMVDNHPPYEIQYDQNLDRDTEAQYRRARQAQIDIAQAFMNATGSGADGIGDMQYQWLVRQGTLAGEAEPTRILRWLRHNSTVEYCAVLGANVYGPWKSDPAFGLTERDLVSTLLGGDPL
jgi:hypothetical protein